ncbi:Clavaminate synthase-like protein [Panus rudis PR-1116 ss-1]|nr:Clavaminate synthase-like protein [Panus rudis PR-1116 ss-1]
MAHTQDSSDAASCSRMPHSLGYVEFFSSYLSSNIPVIFGKPMVSAWPAFNLWTTNGSRHSNGTSNGSGEPLELHPNWDYLIAHYGHFRVTVADCSKYDEFGNQDRKTMLLHEVISKWKENEHCSLYVKDWHLARDLEKENQKSSPFYDTPVLFRDDWMNSYYTGHTDDDFRFVYMGAEGTFTPLHRDVYTSYSWSTNIFGRKRWWLFPPEQTPYLFMKNRNVNVYDIRKVDEEDFPDIRKAKPIVVEQEAGETIFVPSGWYHQVENLTFCISINHNWCNSVNLPSLYASMCTKVVEVENALEDVRELLSSQAHESNEWKAEWVQIVQNVVKQDAGWNWITFWKMILHVLLNLHLQPCNQETFPPAPSELRPAVSFVLDRVEACLDNFMTRDPVERSGDIADILQQVQECCEKLRTRDSPLSQYHTAHPISYTSFEASAVV